MNAIAQNPDLELRAYLLLTRHLPDWPGVTALYNRLIKGLYLRKPRPLIRTRAHGFAWELEPGEAVDGNVLFAPHLYERAEIDFMRAHLRAGDTFLDVGSNIGYYALLAAECVGPTGRVVAIEADPYTYAKLVRNQELNQLTQLTALAVGASDREETATFYVIEGGNRGMSSFGEDRRTFGSARPVEVPCKPLAGVVRETGLPRVTGLKIDIEGTEYPVLKAFFEQAPATHWPTFVLVEHVNFAREISLHQHDTLGLLRAHGYEIRLTTDANYGLIRPVSRP